MHPQNCFSSSMCESDLITPAWGQTPCCVERSGYQHHHESLMYALTLTQTKQCAPPCLSFIKGYLKQHFTVFSHSYWNIEVVFFSLLIDTTDNMQEAINRYRLKFVSDPHSRKDYFFESFLEYWSSYIVQSPANCLGGFYTAHNKVLLLFYIRHYFTN